MRSYCGFYLFFIGFLLASQVVAQDSIGAEDSVQAKHALDQSFQTENSDSILYFLNQAVRLGRGSNLDAYAEALVEKGLAFERDQNGDSSSYYFSRAITVANEKKPSTAILAKIYKQYGNQLGHQNLYAPALSYLDTAANLYLNVTDTLSYADVISMKGTVYDNGGNEEEALRLYLEASKIYEHFEDHVVQAGIINNVAIVYKKLGDLRGALEYYNKSIEIKSTLNDTIGAAIAKVNRGMLYKDLKNYDLALLDVQESLDIFVKRKMNYGAAIAHHNLAEIHLQLNHLDSVLFHVDASQKLAIDLQYWLTVVNNNIVLTKALQDMGRPRLSVKTALRAYDMSIEHGFLESQAELTALLSENYESVGEFQSSLKYFKKYKLIKDSLFNKESQQQVNRLRTEYDLQQKEVDIKGLELINSYQTTLVEKEERLKYGLITGIIFSLLVMILFFILYQRQKILAIVLTKRKTQLTGLNKEKDDLIAMVAHDLRSPLNNIKGLLGIIKTSDEEDRDKMIELANQSTDVLRTRINQILDVEAINVGKINLKIEDVNVSEILEKLTHHILPEANKKRIGFSTKSKNGLICKTDANYLLQVLENLCTNAIKFSMQKSKIDVRVTQQEGKIRFEVADQGQGIAAEEMEELFSRYAKISTVPTENEKSTGLGLPIVKKYVEAMKGTVWAKSEINVGSTFFIELPQANK